MTTASPAPAGRGAAPAVAVVLAATFLNQFGSTAIGVALPSVESALDTSYAAVQWVLAGYLLPFALLLVAGGRLGDVVGHRRVFVAGMAGFAAASLLAGAAPGIGTLIAARVLQGVAAALMAPQVLAVIQVVVPAARRAPALAAYGSVVSLGTVSGPILGGLLIHADLAGWGWRSLFLVNVPVGAAVVLGGLAYLPRSRPAERARLGIGQVLGAAAVLLLLVYPLTHGRELGWPWWLWLCLVAAAPALALFVASQRRAAMPLVPLALFRIRAFTTGLLATFIVASLITGYFVVFAVYVQEGLGRDVLEAGWTVAPWTVGTALGSMAAIPLAYKLGRVTLMIGAAFMVVGMATLSVTTRLGDPVPPGLPTAAGLFVFGVGITMVAAPMMDLTLAAIPKADAGLASGVFSTVRQTGAAFGVAVIGAIYFGLAGESGATGESGTTGAAAAADHTSAIQVTSLAMLGSCLVVLLLVSLLPVMSPRPTPVPATHPHPEPAKTP
ncbi:MFS transporter [Actinomycetes bacterium KLBMP 9797]